jgi:hypothetical protein
MQPQLCIEALEDRLVPSFIEGTTFVTVSIPRIAIGAGVGGGEVRVYDPSRGNLHQVLRLTPFGADFTGGVNVATADVNGDTIPDVVAGMASGGSGVKVLDGKTGAELVSLTAFDPNFAGGVNVAVGKVAGAFGAWGIVVGVAGQGAPHVKVFGATTGQEEQSFFAFEPEFTGGLTVAAGDVNRDGRADVVVGAGAGGGPRVLVFDGNTHAVTRSFFAYDPSFTGGVNVAVTSTRVGADIVVGSDAPGQAVRYIGPDSMFDSPAAPFIGTGSRVAAANFANEGSGTDTPFPPIIVTGAAAGGGPRVNVVNPFMNWYEGASFFAFDSRFRGGVSVAAASQVIDSVYTVPAPLPGPSSSGPTATDPTQPPGGTK